MSGLSRQETICFADDWQAMAYCAKQTWANTVFAANEINPSWSCVQTCCVGAEGPGLPLYLLLIQEHQNPLNAFLALLLEPRALHFSPGGLKVTV